MDAQDEHKAVIQAKYDSIKQAEVAKIEGEKAKKERKAHGIILREKKKKDQALEKFKDEIDNGVLYKGEVVSVLSQNLIEPTGNFSNEKFMGAPGGHVLQIWYTLEGIFNKYPQGLKQYMEKKINNDDDDYFLRPNTPRELLLAEHFMPFLMQYLKDLKNDCIEI